MSTNCIPCLRGFCAACKARVGNSSCACSHMRDNTGIGGASNVIPTGAAQNLTVEQASIANELGLDFIDGASQENDSRSTNGVGSKPKRERRQKPDSAIRDATSTGRKRAARIYPLNRDAPCEWSTANPNNKCGGGAIPITEPCEGKQQARHHGPDKNTLNNDEGNVHRICHKHHAAWHNLNDPEYDPTKPLRS